LRDLPGDFVELAFVVPGPVKGTIATVATLLDFKNIAYVTRVVHVPDDAPKIILGA